MHVHVLRLLQLVHTINSSFHLFILPYNDKWKVSSSNVGNTMIEG